MKKVLLFTPVLCLMFILALQVMSYAVPAPLSDFVLLASDTFDAPDGTSFADYNGGTGFTSKWTSDAANTSTSFNPARSIKAGGFYIPKTSTATTTYRRLSNIISLNEEAEYYISVDVNFISGNNYQRLYLRDSGNTGARAIYAGTVYSADAAVNNMSAGALNTDIFTKNADVPDGTYTMVMKISARNGWDSIKARVFTNPEVEAPSFAPLYWDEEQYSNTTGYTNIDSLQLGTSGSTTSDAPMFDNIFLYKAEPIKVAQALSNNPRYMSAGETITISVNPQNIAGKDQTAVITWHDAENMSQTLHTGESYLVPESMTGKILRAKVVLTDSDSDSVTYYPVSRVIHNKYMLSKMSISKDLNRTGRINYTDWTKNNTVYFNAEFIRSKSNDQTGSVQLILVQYGADKKIKSVSTVSDKVTAASATAIKRLQIPFTLVHGEDPNYTNGDTFRMFMWYSDKTTFEYNLVQPMSKLIGNDFFESSVTVVVP